MAMKKILIVLFFLFNAGAEEILPAQYEQLKGCEKQELLWDKVLKTKHEKLPKYEKFGFIQVVKMSFQSMKKKVNNFSDVSPKGWKKYLHRRGAMAKVKFVPENSEFSGIFQGAECALLRLSLTFDPKKRGVAPGLALKVFRDKVHSANISALYALKGQGKNYNFFSNPLSNIVPTGSGFGAKLVKKIFEKVTDKAEQLKVDDMSFYNTKGLKNIKSKTPVQLFFVPIYSKKSQIKSTPHDIREDLLKIPQGTRLYEVRALGPEFSKVDYSKYKVPMIPNYVKVSKKIGEIITTSEFLASSFGDDGILFRHEVHKKK